MLAYPRSLPDAGELLTYLGWPLDSAVQSQAAQHLATASQMVKAYTRAKGFEKDAEGDWLVEEDLAAAITSCAARSLNNPTADVRIEAGSFNTMPGTFQGWTLAELAVLHAYRRRVG